MGPVMICAVALDREQWWDVVVRLWGQLPGF